MEDQSKAIFLFQILWIISGGYCFLCYLAVLIAPGIIKGDHLSVPNKYFISDLNARSTGPPIAAKTLFWAIDVVVVIWIFTVVKNCYIHIREIER